MSGPREIVVDVVVQILEAVEGSEADMRKYLEDVVEDAKKQYADKHLMDAFEGALNKVAAENEEKVKENKETLESMREFDRCMQELRRQGLDAKVVREDDNGPKVKVDKYVLTIRDVLMLGKMGALDLEHIRRLVA